MVWAVSHFSALPPALLTPGPSEARPLKDACGRHLTVLAGQPSDPSYADAANCTLDALLAEGEAAKFSPAQSDHKRGGFPAVNAGVLYGQGHTIPAVVDLGCHGPMVHRLLQNPHIQRIASYMSCRCSPHPLVSVESFS